MDWCIANKRFFIAAALFVALLILLRACTGEKAPQQEQTPDTETTSTEPTTEESPIGNFELDSDFEKDAHEDINNLIANYFKAYASGDIDTLEMIATPISDNEKSYIGVFSEYIESYENVVCYTKRGLAENSYMVSVYFDLKFYDVATMAPGLDFFYVETADEGNVYINNLYSPYNLSRMENSLDPDVYAVIREFEKQEDSAELREKVENAYTEAVASDVDLASMLSITIPNAMTAWIESVTAPEQDSTEPAEGETEDTTEPAEGESETVEEPAEETPAEEEQNSAQEETPQEEEPEEENTVVKVKVNIKSVNVREKASKSADVIAGAKKGDTFTKLGEEDDWTKIDYKGKTGYIKSEYLTVVTE